MALISFKDWRLSLGESSPHTRWRDGWLKGNYPARADVASRSTPSPAAWEKAEEELGGSKKKKKKKKKES